jgi:non-ribosomal peptide synthetase component F
MATAGGYQVQINNVVPSPARSPRYHTIPAFGALPPPPALLPATPATLAQAVEAQAARTPGAVALICDGQALTYQKLNAQANRLAQRLRAGGIGPEVRVGVRLARSPDLVVAVLAILKAGGAYVPIDPAYPADRQAFMLADSRAALLLTHRATRATATGEAIPVLDLDAQAAELAAQPGSDLLPLAGPTNLAYLIYTSGSTGTPKGVMITHDNALAFLAWCRQLFTPRELAGVAAGTSI